jgi:hypothetical protein
VFRAGKSIKLADRSEDSPAASREGWRPIDAITRAVKDVEWTVIQNERGSS